MLGDRHEFEMGIVHLLEVRHQPVGQFPPVQERAILVPLPGSGMQLVDRDGLMLPVEAVAPLKPGIVLPCEVVR